MLRDYENRKTEKCLYSSALDMLLSWGRISLFHPLDAEKAGELEEDWKMLSQEISMTESLKSGYAELAQDTDAALHLLSGCLYPDPFSHEAMQIQTALEILDNTVLLSAAVSKFPYAESFPADFAKQLESLLKKITTEHAPSVLRLIPLNEWRREISAYIPQEIQYLFPWYCEWTDVPSDTLEQIIEKWDHICKNNLTELSLSSETIPVLLADLSADRGLLSHIRKHAALNQLIPMAIKESFALRLLALSSREARNYDVSEKVEEKGLVTCACHIIRQIKEKLRSESEKLEGVFLAAFCGPFLNESQRISLLEDIEEELPKIDPASLKSGSILKKVMDYQQGNLPEKDFATAIFRHWMKNLESSALKSIPAVAEEAAVFWQAVKNLRLPIVPTKKLPLIEHMKDCYSSIIEFIVPRKLSTAHGGSDDIQEKFVEFSFDQGNIFYLPIRYFRKQFTVLGDIPDHHQLEKLLARLNQIETYCWNGFYKITGQPEEPILLKTETRSIKSLYNLPKKNYEYILILVSVHREIIDKVVSGESLSEDEKKQIVFLKYTPEEKS